MTTITTTLTIFILTFLLCVAIGGILHCRRRITSLQSKVSYQEDLIELYRDKNMDPDAIYTVRRVRKDLPEYGRYAGHWGVCRTSIKKAAILHTTIKVFTDPDDDFNRREAEELCEILNAK